MDPATVAALIEDATRLFDPVPDLEITLEANPTSVEAGRLADFRAAGVNRISIGVQSLDARGAAHARPRALGGAGDRRPGDRPAPLPAPLLRPDLCPPRPGRAAWRAELRQALDLAADHLSLYQLTIEPGTRFEALHRRGEIVLPDADTAAALYEATAEEAARFGLLAYEVSNYARPAPRAGTTSPTGATPTTPASVPARTGG